ncbi:MAG: transketolase [Eubacteriales bacterium]|nr:transketolase [Eubacteriales bacterium]
MNNIEQTCINSIRILSAEAVEKASSGHPGLPMGAAPMAFELWANHMKHNPLNPKWDNRDRFILSAGHGSMLIYSLLHLFNYGLTIEDLKNFRQLGSKTPGHPEYGHTIGVETTTGPLGQGFANGVGMAVAESHLAAKFNKPGLDIVDHYTYVLSGDGCMMEGIASEAASFAGTYGLGKLIVFYDSNKITIEGNTDITFREDVGKRFEAYGWDIQYVDDANDIKSIGKAIDNAKKNSDKPHLIVVKSIIGYGCPNKQGKASAHGEPLGTECMIMTKEFLGWQQEEEFSVPDEVRKHMSEVTSKLAGFEAEWNSKWNEYKEKYPELAQEYVSWHSNEIDIDLLNNEELWSFDSKPEATRNISGTILNRLSRLLPNLIGGSADLASSNKTIMKDRKDYSPEDYSGSNLHFGIREHAMAAMGNGMMLHGGLRPYVATFFVFSDYMKPSMRLSALMRLPLIYILTHDSIGVGEDGPTHEPVEQLAALRSIPGFTDFRPCDAKETAAGWYAAVSRKDSPTALMLTRQKLPQLEETGKDALKGAYVLYDTGSGNPDIILMASGSEVSMIYEAGKILGDKGIKVRTVSMPSWKLFEEQSAEYKESVLPSKVVKRLAVEAASPFGWYRYIGLNGAFIGMESFGASGKYEQVYKKFGITVDNVVKKALELIGK